MWQQCGLTIVVGLKLLHIHPGHFPSPKRVACMSHVSLVIVIYLSTCVQGIYVIFMHLCMQTNPWCLHGYRLDMHPQNESSQFLIFKKLDPCGTKKRRPKVNKRVGGNLYVAQHSFRQQFLSWLNICDFVHVHLHTLTKWYWLAYLMHLSTKSFLSVNYNVTYDVTPFWPVASDKAPFFFWNPPKMTTLIWWNVIIPYIFARYTWYRSLLTNEQVPF